MAAAQTPELFPDRFGFHAEEIYLIAESLPFEKIQYRVNAPDLSAEVAGDLAGAAPLLLVLTQYFQERLILVGERRMPKGRRGALVIGSSELRRCPLASSRIAMRLRSNSRSSQ